MELSDYSGTNRVDQRGLLPSMLRRDLSIGPSLSFLSGYKFKKSF
jgi:hypothetical protein